MTESTDFLVANAFLAETTHGSASELPGESRCEVVGVNHYHKEGLLTEKSTGKQWWMVSDEGEYMGGTELGPAPLMYWLVGLEASLTLAIVEHLKTQGVNSTAVRVLLRQDYGISGSFSKGDAMGVGGPVTIEVDVDCDAPRGDVETLVQELVKSSPDLSLCRALTSSTFALYTNGRYRELPTVDPAPARPEDDPFRRYASTPSPATQQPGVDVLVRMPLGQLEAHTPVGQEDDGRVWFSLTSEGTYDFDRGVVESVSELSGSRSRRWRFTADPTGQVAPTPEGILSIGVAFCYHTQLARFAKVRKMEVENPRLLQDNMILGGSQWFETHVYVNGEQGEEACSDLVTTAMNTCYAHKTLGSEVSVTATLV